MVQFNNKPIQIKPTNRKMSSMNYRDEMLERTESVIGRGIINAAARDEWEGLKERFTDAMYCEDSTMEEKDEKIRRLELFMIEMVDRNTELMEEIDTVKEKCDELSREFLNSDMRSIALEDELNNTKDRYDAYIDELNEELLHANNTIEMLDEDSFKQAVHRNDPSTAQEYIKEATRTAEMYKASNQNQLCIIDELKAEVKEFETVVSVQEKTIREQGYKIRAMKVAHQQMMDDAASHIDELEITLLAILNKKQQVSPIYQMMEPVQVIPAKTVLASGRPMDSWCDP